MSGEADRGGKPVTPTGDPIMTAKFRIPAPQPWTIDRPRLLDRLSRGAGGPLTLVTAPAGSGKTVLAGAWATAHRAAGPTVWISLDEQDDQPGVLWSYILSGLGHAGVTVAGVGRPERSDGVERSLLVRLAATLSEQPRPVTLVLDDAQVLTRPEVPQGIDFLLRRAVPQLHVVLLSRVEPALPLHRYRLAGSITEIRLDELAFTAPEVHALLAAHGTELPDAEVAALARRTRGWPASVRLAALSLQHQAGNGSPAERADLQAGIGDYFVAEILDAQPAGIRDFLLRTSVVDRMRPALVAELSGQRDAARTLARLARTHTFVAPSRADPHSYEYHPIVRDLLRAQLRQEAPHRVRLLHRKAAHWLADDGRTAEAIGHAAAAGDWEHAVALLVGELAIGRLLSGPGAVGLVERFTGMPADLTGPQAAVVYAALALCHVDTDLCAKHLLRAGEVVGTGPAGHDEHLRLAVAAVDLVRARICGEDAAARTAAANAQALIADLGTVPADLRASVALNKGRVLLWAGEVDAAGTAFAEAVAFTDTAAGEYLRRDCLGQLALVEVLRGRLRRAGELGRQAGTAGTARCEWPAAADAALAWVHTEEYDLKSARERSDRAAALLEVRPDPVAAAMLGVVRARWHRARGDTAHAPPTVQSGQSDVPGWLRERLTAVDDPESPHAPLDVRVDAWLRAAAGELARGRTESARGALLRALRAAEPERLRRPFVEAIPPLRRLLRQDRELAGQHAWLGSALTGNTEARPPRPPGTTVPNRPAPTAVGPRPAPIVEPLTGKETEVLQHLAELASTEEIARKMFVSVNTVKTHIRGVLRKLAASRRNEAVRRARDMGLV
jgi:LuxR family maltose regulon positive regulatory protein